MKNETLRTKYTYELIAFHLGNAGYGVSEGPIFKFVSGGTCPRTPHIIRAFRADSQLVSSNNLVLNVQLQKNLCQDKTNDDTKSE